MEQCPKVWRRDKLIALLGWCVHPQQETQATAATKATAKCRAPALCSPLLQRVKEDQGELEDLERFGVSDHYRETDKDRDILRGCMTDFEFK